MLEIRPISDRHEQEALAARFRIPFSRDALTYGAFLEEAPAALCQFRCLPPERKGEGTALLLSLGQMPRMDRGLSRLLLAGVLAFCLENGCTSFRCAPDFPADAERIARTLFSPPPL